MTSLRQAAETCEGCELYKNATQTVFGEGPRKAQLFLVGTMPGDREDLEGKPFVGPAGRLLDKAFHEVGLKRGDVYLTNVVKHFKWEERGKRRFHKDPRQSEVVACSPWLKAEISTVQPAVIFCLGAKAAQSLLGRDFRITRQRGELVANDWAPWAIASWHPAAVLRAPTSERRAEMRQEFIADLHKAKEAVEKVR